MPEVTFYFDVGSPYAYLASERLLTVLPGPVRWQPVLLGGLFRLAGRSSWSLGDPERRRRGMAEIERRADAYGLPPLRWPQPWPTDYLMAMRAATFAFTVGRGYEFALTARRAAFQRGIELGEPECVLDAAEAAGLGREEVRAAVADPAVKQSLRDATDIAYAAGVVGVPTVAIGEELFWGDDRLEEAAERLR